jgi:hypothetical protein
VCPSQKINTRQKSTYITENHVWITGISPLYLGGPAFQILAQTQLLQLKFFMAFLNTPRQILRYCIELGHDLSFPNPFPIIIH